MKLAGNVKQKKKLMVVLKTPRRTIEAKLFSGLAALLSWERAWPMLDLLLVPHHLRQQKMQGRWRVLVRMRTPRCQCSPSFGTLLQLMQSRRMEARRQLIGWHLPGG